MTVNDHQNPILFGYQADAVKWFCDRHGVEAHRVDLKLSPVETEHGGDWWKIDSGVVAGEFWERGSEGVIHLGEVQVLTDPYLTTVFDVRTRTRRTVRATPDKVPTMTQRPSVGRIVHYVSYGTPGGEFPKACRAAVITGVGEPLPYPRHDDKHDPLDPDSPELVDLCVLNPSGWFFGQGVPQDERPGAERSGGTWHWPERVD